MFNIIIKNGLIVDGSGREAYHSDIAIKDGKIVDIQKCFKDSLNLATEIIEAKGLVVSPGFIDVHSHNDLMSVPVHLCAFAQVFLFRGYGGQVA